MNTTEKEPIQGTQIYQADLLQKLSEKADYFESEIEPVLHDRLITVMENMRSVLGIRQKDFANLIGITKNAYNLAVCKKRPIVNVSYFVRFCYLFGYDFEQLVFSDVASRRDAAVHELAIRIANLPDDFIDNFCQSASIDERIGGFKAHALRVAFSNYQSTKAETLTAAMKDSGSAGPLTPNVDEVHIVDESPV